MVNTLCIIPAIPRSPALEVCMWGGGGGAALLRAWLQMTGALLTVQILPFHHCSVESTSHQIHVNLELES